jgi:hypothetical protein
MLKYPLMGSVYSILTPFYAFLTLLGHKIDER